MVGFFRIFRLGFVAGVFALAVFATPGPSPAQAREQSSGAALIMDIIQFSEESEVKQPAHPRLLGDVLFDQGVQNFYRNNYTQAARWFTSAADRGIVKAYLVLTVMHVDGLGVPRNHTEAMKWYRKAADRNRAKTESMFRIAKSIEAGPTIQGNAASACITFNPPLRGGKRVRYDDYVNVRPASRDLVMASRNGKLCIDGLSFGEEYEVSLLPCFPGFQAPMPARRLPRRGFPYSLRTASR